MWSSKECTPTSALQTKSPLENICHTVVKARAHVTCPLGEQGPTPVSQVLLTCRVSMAKKSLLLSSYCLIKL